MGLNWLPRDFAYYTIAEGGDLAFIWGPRKAYWFHQAGADYVANFGAKVTLTLALGVFTLTESDGTQHLFDEATGALLESISPGGQVTANSFVDNKLVAVTRTVGSNSEIREFTYYGIEAGANAGRLKYVTLKRSVNPLALLRRLEFRYYDSNLGGGPIGALSTVIEQALQSDGWADIATHMYRYYKTGETAGVVDGLLKCIVNPEGYARLAKTIDPLLASDEETLAHSDAWYKYASDGSRRLSEIKLAGGTRTYLISFSENTNSGYSDGYNTWKYKTIVTHPDGYLRRFYANHIGQEILNIKEHPTDSDVYWATYTERWGGVSAKAPYVSKIVPPKGINGRPTENSSPASTPPFLTIPLTASGAAVRTFDYFTTAGNAKDGYLKSESIQDGTGGSILIREYDYSLHTVSTSSTQLVLISSRKEIPVTGTSNEDITTTYAYTLFGASSPWLPQIKTRTTTLPVIPNGTGGQPDQNGNGQTYTQIDEYDIQGRLAKHTDESSVVTEYEYDDVTGARVRMTEDKGSGRLNLVTDYTVDDFGRTLQTLGPVRSPEQGVNGQSVRSATWTVYKDVAHEVWSAKGCATGTDSGPSYSFSLINPVAITKMDHDGRKTDQLAAVRADAEGPLSSGDAFPQSSWVRWTTNSYNDAGQGSSTRVYHAIPDSGPGAPGENYAETTFGYDIMGRQNCVRSPGGTIMRTAFDPRGLPTQTWVGTNDTGATDSDPDGPTPPSPTIANPNNMVLVTENIYDGGFPSASIKPGNGLVTQVKRYATASEVRTTDFVYDFRDRQIEQHAIIHANRKVITAQWYDNLDRATFTRQYDTQFTYDATNPVTPANETTNLIGKSQRLTDKRGRVYRSKRWSVSFGAPLANDNFSAFIATIGNALEDNTWYDGRNQAVKQKPAGSQGYTKPIYDALSRTVLSYICYSPSNNDDPWQVQPTVSDKVFAQTVTNYDEAGNAVTTYSLQRNSDQTGMVALGAATARTTYAAAWFDGANRPIAAANYGTNGGASFSRPSMPPESASGVLVTKTSYNDRGEAFETADPAGMVTRRAWDDAGRAVESIQNYQANGSGADVNVTTRTSYTLDGNVATLTAVNPVTGDQTTHYTYGTTLADSDIARSDLLVGEVYPDAADSADRVRYEYNRQGDRVLMVDQNDTEHQYAHDLLGRVTADAVTVLGTGVDGAVRRLATAYEIRGMAAVLTSYDAASSGTLVNQVTLTRNGFGQLTNDGQKHASGGSFVNVGYTYANGSANTIRRESTVYPYNTGSRTLGYAYGSAGDDNDKLGRVSALSFAGGTVVQYGYFGAASIASVTYPEPATDITLTLANGADYSALDQFGRVIDLAWKQSTTDLARLQYGYDLASNRTFRRDVVAHGLSKPFDELYTYDGLHRLESAARGLLNAGNTAITSPTFGQTWELDQTGNWDRFTEFDNQGTTFTALDQTRTQNNANEIEFFAATTGPVWQRPDYDRSGNMTTMPRPAAPEDCYDATYDAWNRLVLLELAGTSTKVGEYEYDALNRRTVKNKYVNGALNETRHYFYSDDWQVLEERVGSSSVPDHQWVSGIRYVDDCVLRDELNTSTGALVERLYALQDGNWNVVAIASTAGVVAERFVYNSYGYSAEYSSIFGTPTTKDWDVRFTGQRLDRDSSIYLYRSRYYDWNTGRFLTRDPLSYAASLATVLTTPLSVRQAINAPTPLRSIAQIGPQLSLYEYVNSSPLTSADPLGLREYKVVSGIGLEGILWGLLDEAEAWLILECEDGKTLSAHIGWSTFSLAMDVTFDASDNMIKDSTVKCKDGKTVSCKDINVGIKIEILKLKTVQTGRFVLRACCCNCSDGTATPGEVPPDGQDIDEWIDDASQFAGIVGLGIGVRGGEGAFSDLEK